jgi:predicted glycoside hydrolase/deacetylase ChbG (UPF0249 family)
MTELKSIILCADDFAQDRAVSAAILDLADAGRLSAVSCFTDSPLWAALGPQLAKHSSRLLLGVHFNLTHELGFGERPLAYWIAGALLGSLDSARLRETLQRQIDRFVAIAGAYPDFIDGHHHVHAFPQIRDVVRSTVEATGKHGAARIRDVSRPVGRTDAPVKRTVIKTLARLGGGHVLRRDRVLNTAFAGDYSLSPRARYDELFADWLRQSPDGGLIMCHPRCGSEDRADLAGQEEYAFLMSRAFPDLLAHSHCALARKPVAPSRPAPRPLTAGRSLG